MQTWYNAKLQHQRMRSMSFRPLLRRFFTTLPSLWTRYFCALNGNGGLWALSSLYLSRYRCCITLQGLFTRRSIYKQWHFMRNVGGFVGKIPATQEPHLLKHDSINVVRRAMLHVRHARLHVCIADCIVFTLIGLFPRFRLLCFRTVLRRVISSLRSPDADPHQISSDGASSGNNFSTSRFQGLSQSRRFRQSKPSPSHVSVSRRSGRADFYWAPRQ